jgi:uncharacterized membrane protein (UPF0182 family)
MGARAWMGVIVAVAAVLLLVGRTATAMFVDHAWFEAMGAPALFWEQVTDTALLQGGAWIAGSLFAFANLHAVRRTILAVAVPARVANLELTAMVPGRRLLTATIVLALIVGAILALPLTNWETLAMVRHGLPFGEIEGIFDRDLGHYVYWLPFEETLYLWALVSVVALTAMVLVLYALTRSLRLEGRRIAASSHVRRHLSVLGALVLLLLSWSYRLDGFDLLLAGGGPDGLFLRVDHRVTLRMDSVLAYGSAIAALIILRTGWVGQLRAAFVTLTVVLLAAVGLRHGVPALLARGDTLGDPARRDADYVAARALYSRRAFNVDALQPPADSATDGAIASGVPVAAGALAARASLWDASMLAEARGAGSTGTQSAPPDGRGGSDRSRATSDQSRLATMVDAAVVGWAYENGRVMALQVDRPVVSGEPWHVSLTDATQPMVRDSVIDRPDAGADATGPWPLVGPGVSGARLLDGATSPDVAGALLDTPQSRIAHAWALRDIALLGGDSMMTTPLLVAQRDVRERVRRLAPIFEQGTTLYPVRDQGAFYWVLHLYSASDRYPFSQRWQVGDGVFTYYQLAATAIVNAGTGRVRLVPVSKPDAIARTWMTRLPRLFTPVSALPASLAAQLPPASDAAEVQLRTFARYGSRAEGARHRHPPDSAFVGGPGAPIMLARGDVNVPAWTLPLLDERDGVAGVATVVGGAARQTLWTPLRPPSMSWPVIVGQLRQAIDSVVGGVPSTRGADASVSSTVLPAGRMGSNRSPLATDARSAPRSRLGRPEAVVTSRGPLFMQAAMGVGANGIPQVRAVAVSDGAQTSVGRTLGEALRAFGERVEPLDGPPVGAAGFDATAPGRDAARRWYDAMRDAMTQGDWSAFGAAFDSLGRSLGRSMARPPQ